MVPSKIDVRATKRLFARQPVWHVDPKEMEIAKRESERITQAHSGVNGLLPGGGGGSSEEEAGWSASEDEDEETERTATTLPAMMTEEQQLEAAIQASMSR